ncbi:class I SAM-dependent methyltransferase [Shewanella sp. AS1]|uniref:class I SAM-dependent methyltransferase n=1 Tax=Shewanella sp. AS1 TaxID=2907626 RepID=UPI001F1EDED7|nr:class I SAM-dependent methyltransferase [Shewanella sp. AS1]MCE9678877.1 class I SAM-dependent methyltransferase [Shewanella sp. AS1]
MTQDEITALFDQQAANYDNQWVKTAPIRHCLHLLLGSLFAELPTQAKILCVGVGTGDELLYLAEKFPEFSFTLVEPSGPMLEVCRQRAEQEGITFRCDFYQGYVESISTEVLHDAATCFLVSQFMLDTEQRRGFFTEIARRLKPNGLLASTDLASDINSPEYQVLLSAWMNMMSSAELTSEVIERMRSAYANDVGVLEPSAVATIISSAGFKLPVPFFQAGLIHGWLSRRV